MYILYKFNVCIYIWCTFSDIEIQSISDTDFGL